jgi:1-acyl-sn-glycerol-3-phosphate acyltransferase
MGPVDFHNRDVTKPAESSPPSRAPRRRAAEVDPTRIQDLFLARLEEIERRVSSELARPAEASGALQELALDLGRELWAQTRRIAAMAATPTGWLARLVAAAPTDDLGVDERLRDTVHDVASPLSRVWLGLDPRAEEKGLDLDGPALLLLNRDANPAPVDALVAWSYLREGLGASGRKVFALWSPAICSLPYLGDWLGRLGIFAASASNCRALLERGAVVIVFPEGDAALGKSYEQRYRLARFDDRALVETAVACGAKIVPGAVLGNEESFPLITRAWGWPVTPLFPWFGVAGLLPLPIRWTVRIGAAVQYVDDGHDGGGAGAVVDAVRARMQELLVGALAARRTIISG